MKIVPFTVALFCSGFFAAQAKQDNIKQKNIEEVVLIGKKPTVESKADRTVFNVANSSILAGNTTWDVLRMTPLVSIDSNDVVKAEGESAVSYTHLDVYKRQGPEMVTALPPNSSTFFTTPHATFPKPETETVLPLKS